MSALVAEPQEERKTMAITQPRARRVKPLDAGPFAPEIGSFRLHLAAEGKAPKTVRTYVEAVAWFAAAHPIERTRCTQWDEVSCHDVQRWLIHLLTPVQRRLCQQSVPGSAAVLPLAGGRGAARGPDGRAACPEGAREAGAGVHQRRTFGAGEGVPGPVVRPAA